MIELYTKPLCGQCDSAKALLKNKGFNFSEYYLDRDYTKEELVESYPTARTFPVVLVNGHYIGGLENLKEWLNQNDGKQLITD